MQGRPHFSEKGELVKFISENNVKILNLCHIPEEGRLKTLSFSASDKNRVCEVLELGERVDGSSLFSFIDPGKSDIYIKPDIGRVFVNPFSILPTLNVLCDYLDENGKPLEIAPKNVLARAEEQLQSSANIVLKALAELEFYIVEKQQGDLLFPGVPDRNYHESAPFSRFEDLRGEILATLDFIGLTTKYGHGEVGRLLGKENTLMEQQEIEFMPQKLQEMAETIAVSKWIVRNVCARRGVAVTFIPKVGLGNAGTGMHIHLCGLKKGKNIAADPDGALSNETLRMIGGILKFAPSLAAFGNPTPASYLRFIAPKESPMHVCWSARNRLALVRIPLWWNFMKRKTRTGNCMETFEYRAPDAFANAYLLFAGLTVAVDYAFENSAEALKIAEDLHVDAEEHGHRKLDELPHSCNEVALNLEKDRKYYEDNGVFPKTLIDKTVEKLQSFDDKNLWKELAKKPDQIESMLQQYFHYG